MLVNTVILCALCSLFFSTLSPRFHVQFIPRYLASVTDFAYVSILPQGLHIALTVCINFESPSKLALSRH
jgi:hypothetical protein